MKKLLVMMLVLVATQAQARILAYTSNENGGRIELMTEAVPDSVSNMTGCANAHIAKSWDGRQDDIYGCWTMLDDTILVNWVGAAGGNNNRTYPLGAFTIMHPVKLNQKKAM